MQKSIVNYDNILPEIPDRCPWEKPTSYLVKDDSAETGWREEASSRRPSELILVPAIRSEVDAWRNNNYKGATDITQHLFRYWFEEDHDVSTYESPFRYYFGQRESIETLAWLIEISKIRDTKQLIESIGSIKQNELKTNNVEFQTTIDGKRQIRRDLPEQNQNKFQELPPENLRRYAFKMATGSGKTWVMAMVVVWSYFHKYFVHDSELSNNFLIVAPNVIVYQRLKKDFAHNQIFNNLPLIPPEWKRYFSLNTILRDDYSNPNKSKNLFLTNIHQLYESRERKWMPINSVDAILGEKVDKELTSSYKKSVYERVSSLDDLLVINDEAHHVHDDNLAWTQSLLSIDSTLINGINTWLDFSATPKDQNGLYFPWTVVDYPLAQAVEDKIVKSPIIVNSETDNRMSIEDPENITKDNVTEKYSYWIRASVERLKEHQNIYGKLDTKPILFIMAEKNDYADKIGEYLWSNEEFNFNKSEILVIHTDSSGEIRKKDLEIARQAARDIDAAESKIKVIVSVMMLREGWDVRNVSVVLGLRPFTAKAEILPEQVIGRGLRLMVQVSPDRTQTLEVLGTRKLLDVLRGQLEAEGVGIASTQSKPPLPVVIQPISERIEYDIEIPLTKPNMKHNFRRLSKININSLEAIYMQSELVKPLQYKLKMEFATTETPIHEMDITSQNLPSSRQLVTSVTNKVVSYAKLPNRFAELYPVVQKYISNRCFNKKIKLESRRIRSHLASTEMQEAIAKYLAREIAKATIEHKDIQFVENKYCLSQTKPFSWRRNLPPLKSKKTIFNYVATYNNYEREFAEYLDRASDVLRFAALGTTEQGGSGTSFRVNYLKPSGAIGFYYPDWAVVQEFGGGEINWIVETKGRIWEDTDAKDVAIKKWCRQINLIGSEKWRYIRVNQKDFDSDWESFRNLVVTIVGQRMLKERDKRNVIVTQEEWREWREEGRA